MNKKGLSLPVTTVEKKNWDDDLTGESSHHGLRFIFGFGTWTIGRHIVLNGAMRDEPLNLSPPQNVLAILIQLHLKILSKTGHLFTQQTT